MSRIGRMPGAAAAGTAALSMLAMLGLVVAANAARYGAVAAVAGGLVAGVGIWAGRRLFRRSADSASGRNATDRGSSTGLQKE